MTTNDQAYCWDDGYPGQLGIGTYTDQYCMDHDPGRHPAHRGRWRAPIAHRDAHTCGVSTEERAYYWGGDAQGQLGTGTTRPETC